MRFSIFQDTRIGKRKCNQDRLNYSYTRDALLMVVADGMGGHAHGEVAAQIAVQCFADAFKLAARAVQIDPFSFLSQTFNLAHQAINNHAVEHGMRDSPRTTCVACLVHNGVAYWAHVGDSRLYVLRTGKVLVQTRDHSRVQMLLDRGLIDAAAAAVHPERNRVYSCLGGPREPEIEFSRKLTLCTDDVIALCTDGAWAAIPEDKFSLILTTGAPNISVPRLLTLAEANSGEQCDNLTLMAMRWEEGYPATADANGPTSNISRPASTPSAFTQTVRLPEPLLPTTNGTGDTT